VCVCVCEGEKEEREWGFVVRGVSGEKRGEEKEERRRGRRESLSKQLESAVIPANIAKRLGWKAYGI